MADPFTLSFIAANCAWAMIQNRADEAAVGSTKRLAEALRKQKTPANHDVLAATHTAFVRSIQLMADACERSGGDARDHFVARELAKVAKDPGLTTFKADARTIPKRELDASIRAIFEGAQADPGRNAAEEVIVRLEGAMGEPLTENFRTLFRDGSDKHRSWPQAFELFFAEQVKTNERVFRALAFDRLNEILALAEARAGEHEALLAVISSSRDGIRHGFAETADRDARMEGKLDALIEQVMAQRGGQIEDARIDAQAIVRIARKVSENVADADQALAEIDASIDSLLALRRDAARGSNLDSLVETALRRIDERAAAGKFDAAAREAAKAFAEWEGREGDRRDRERAIGIKFTEENMRVNRLRRDADAVATWVLRRARLENEEADHDLAAASSAIGALIDIGRDKGINFDLEIAASLANLLCRAAQDDEQAAASQVWAGVALQTLGQRQEGTKALDEAIAAYRAALTVYTRDNLPLNWAMTQNNLGNALQTLGRRQEGTKALDEAVTAYRAALEVYTRNDHPLDWAMTQNNIGIALRRLGERQEGTETLDETVAAYRAALEVYTREDLPLDWAMMQNNLGVALVTLGERQPGTETLEEAVAAYRAALEIYARDNLPLDWAMTQNNLGNALQTLGQRQEGTKALREAVSAYRAALEVYTRDDLPLDWATTQNNLGSALHALGEQRDGTEALDDAVAAFRAALEVRTRDNLPLDWAATQNNLGIAFASLGKRQEGTEPLNEAIAAYRAALQVYTRGNLPLQWAWTQENLGYAQCAKAHRLSDCAEAQAAVAALKASLEVFAHPALARNRAKAERGLGIAQELEMQLCERKDDLDSQLAAAREVMVRRKRALRKLAK